LASLVALALLVACFPILGSDGGGQTNFTPPRRVDPAGVALPEGYRIEVVATGLTFPTDVTFDDQGRAYVLEAGYSYGEVITTPRLLRLDPDGEAQVVAEGENPPWNGLAFSDGAFYVAGGTLNGGRILRITPDGETTTLVDGLPSVGDHHTNGPAVGPDGWLYFGQGTATNSGVVGTDNADFGWLYRYPRFSDNPCEDVTLTGQNYRSANPLTDDPEDEVITGAFLPFGTPSEPGQVIEGAVPCTGAIMRIAPDGGSPELVAWGLRNPFGLAFNGAGELYVTENSFDERGSRPVFGTGDVMWQIEQGAWYGWPDYHAGRGLDDPDWYQSLGEEPPGLLLSEQPGELPEPVALLGTHSSSNGFDFSRNASFGYQGQAFVAQFGDMAPGVGKVLEPVGFKVVRVNVETGVIEDFAVNRNPRGPASRVGGAGLERPVSVSFSPDGTALYVVDFGVMTIGENIVPREETGVIWRITREGAP
jgi:glucose/arabinose dehydrogenase